MKKLFLILILLCVAASAVERVFDLVTSTGETLKGKTHGGILVMRDDKRPVIAYIRREVTTDDFPWSSYRNCRTYVVYIEGVGKAYMFPTELVGKDEMGCMRGKAYILRDYAWLKKNQGEALTRKEKDHAVDTWTTAIWSWRTLGWDENHGSDPVWGGKTFLKED